jgi:hypothetical protein
VDFLPWSTFDRIVARYNGDRAVKTLTCVAQFQVMAFAQLALDGYLAQLHYPTHLWRIRLRRRARRAKVPIAGLGGALLALRPACAPVLIRL